MTTLVLHIGSPKAGSSAIQRAFAHTRVPTICSDWTVLPSNPYRTLEPAGCVVNLYSDVHRLPKTWERLRRSNPSRYHADILRYHRLLQRKFSRSFLFEPRNFFLSCEYLWNLSSEAILRLKADFCSMGVTKFVIVAYVRHPVQFYLSSLQQHARKHDDCSRFHPSKWFYSFRRRIETWQLAFDDALVIRAFESSQLQEGCVVKDLLYVLSEVLGTAPAVRRRLHNSSANVSFSVEEILAIQRLIKRFPASGIDLSLGRSRVLDACLRRIHVLALGNQCSKLSIKPEIESLILSKHAEDLSWLRNTHMIDFYGCHVTSKPFEGISTDIEVEDPRSIESYLDGGFDHRLVDELYGHLANCRLPP